MHIREAYLAPGTRTAALAVLLWALPLVALAQAASSPFMTGATALQSNILAWLTPIAVILVMALGALAMANRMSWGWCLAAILGIAIAFGAPQILVENCANTLILRCSASEHGGTSLFASRLIGEREVRRIATSRSQRATELFGSVTRSEHLATESAVMGSQIEQLPDLSGYLKLASHPAWHRVRLHPAACPRPQHAGTSEANIVRLVFPARGVAVQPERTAASADNALEPE